MADDNPQIIDPAAVEPQLMDGAAPAVDLIPVVADPAAVAPAPEAGSEKWFNALPKDLAENDSISRYGTLEEMAKAALEKDKMISQSVRIPGEEASAEDKENFLAKLGRPAKYEDYLATVPQELVEHLTINENMIDPLKQSAHRRGLTQDQFQGMYEDFLQSEHAQNQASDAAYQASNDKAMSELRSKWGPDWETNQSKVNTMFKKTFTNPAVAKELMDMGFGMNAGFLEAMVSLHDRSTPGSIDGTTGQIAESGLSLRDQLSTIMNNPEYNTSKELQAEAIKVSEKMTGTKY